MEIITLYCSGGSCRYQRRICK